MLSLLLICSQKQPGFIQLKLSGLLESLDGGIKKQPEGCCCRTPVQCSWSSDSKQQHLFVLAACGNVLLLLMLLRLTWIVWVVMHIYLSLGRLFQAWKAEVKVYRSVYKIMPPTFYCSEWQEFRTGKQAKEKQHMGNNILRTFWGKKSPNNGPCPSCPLKKKQLRKTQIKQNT